MLPSVERENRMRCIVTGVAGFVGSHLAERLLSDGHDVCGIDIFTDYYPRFIKERNINKLRSIPNFTFLEEDLLRVNLSALLEGVEWIFHQAAQAGVRASWGQEFSYYADANILVTQRLLEASRHATKLQRFVYASSSSIYGNTSTFPIVETAEHRPFSPYGVTKLAAEHLCSLYYENFSLPTVSLRYFTVYGPRQRPDMAFHRFCKAIVEHQPLHIYGDGQQTRDFTYISDIVEANVQAATVDAAVGKVLNVAGGSRVTLQQVVELLQEISDTSIEIISDPKQHGDVQHTFADITRTERILGYHPRISLREGLEHELADLTSLYQSASSIV